MSLQSEQFAGNGLRKITFALGTGLATLGVSAALTYGYLELQKYREVQSQWSKAQAFAQASDFDGCLSQTQVIQPQSRYFSKAQLLMQQCRLGQAQVQAKDENFVAAIESALLIPESAQETYSEAQSMIQDWSDVVTAQGQTLLEAGKLEDAIATLRRLPEPVNADVETTVTRWSSDWEKSESAIQTADDLLARGQWLAAKQSLEEVSDVSYWAQKAKPLLARAEAGIAQVEQYEREQARVRSALAAAPRATYTPPAVVSPAPAAAVAPAPAAPAAPRYSPPPAPPPPVAVAPPSLGFDQSVESLYQSYRSQGQGTWDAWTQACRDSGGQIVDQGPEAACLP